MNAFMLKLKHYPVGDNSDCFIFKVRSEDSCSIPEDLLQLLLVLV